MLQLVLESLPYVVLQCIQIVKALAYSLGELVVEFRELLLFGFLGSHGEVALLACHRLA